MATSAVPLRSAIPAARRYIQDLWSRREFAIYLALGNLKARNASTALGLFWWVLNPLLLGAIYALVFGVIFDARRGTTNYIAYLLAGLFAFYYTRAAMVGGVNSIISNTRLLANLQFPRLVLPLSALFESAIGFIVSLGVFYLVAGPVNGVWPGPHIWWLIPGFAVHTVLNFGLAALVARIAVPFRDVNNLVPYVLRLWLYLSPVIWPVTFLDNTSATLRAIIEKNPMFSLLAIYRHALLDTPVAVSDVLLTVAWAGLVAVIGVGSFVRHEGRMTRYL